MNEAANANRAPNNGVELRQVAPYYGKKLAVQPFDLTIAPQRITAIIGPSGCGKSTVLRCINRLHETVLGAYMQGDILVDGQSIVAPGVDPTLVRRRIGMVFQQPNPLWRRSIYENVAMGPRLLGWRDREELDQTVERCLHQAGLWREVKEKLQASATELSGGQQQRLCLARALALEPAVLLLDEPASAIDPISTQKLEDLLIELKATYTIVIVTHNMQQAARIADNTALFLADMTPQGVIGRLNEVGATRKLFSAPTDARTEEYISGRVG
ncbi:MAG: phosphate ABC transporter ATP-binding protein [Caldilineaceae bacterium]